MVHAVVASHVKGKQKDQGVRDRFSHTSYSKASLEYKRPSLRTYQEEKVGVDPFPVF